MDRLISEQKAIEAINDYWDEMETPTIDGYINVIKTVPSAEPCKDTISRGVFEQVRWERDIAIEQLHELGYELGQKIEPCEDAISREAVLKIQAKYAEHMGATKFWQMRDDIKTLQSVNLQEPKTGHWIWQTEDIYRCSECYEDIHVKEVMNVPQYVCCPMCGARMEGVSK